MVKIVEKGIDLTNYNSPVADQIEVELLMENLNSNLTIMKGVEMVPYYIEQTHSSSEFYALKAEREVKNLPNFFPNDSGIYSSLRISLNDQVAVHVRVTDKTLSSLLAEMGGLAVIMFSLGFLINVGIGSRLATLK